MKYSLHLLLISSTCWLVVVGVSSNSILLCSERCVREIPSEKVCNDICKRILETTTHNITGNGSSIPPVPSIPRLLSHTYRTLTVGWSPGLPFDYNTTVVRYVLEVTRHKNVSDPLIILPIVEKYHVVSGSQFTSPYLEAMTNYTMRVAAVSASGTSGFSVFSPIYETNTSSDSPTIGLSGIEKRSGTEDVKLILLNDEPLHHIEIRTCDRTIQRESNQSFPCPVTNIRLRITVGLNAEKTKQRVKAKVLWSLPADIGILHENYFKVKLVESHHSNSRSCHDFGRSFNWLWKVEKFTNQTTVEEDRLGHSLYMGCRYTVNFAGHRQVSSDFFRTSAEFLIPDCIQNFCVCFAPRRTNPFSTVQSKHIDVQLSEPKIVNQTYFNATITWNGWAWGRNLSLSFFSIAANVGGPPLQMRCSNSWGKLKKNKEKLFVQANATSRRHSVILGELKSGCRYLVLVQAFTPMACVVEPTKIFAFKAKYLPPTTPAAPRTPTTNTPTVTTQLTVTTATTDVTTGTRGAPEEPNGALIAIAVVIPLIVILLIAFLILLFLYQRRKKSSILQRTPTGLQRLTDSLDMESHIYHRNLDQMSTQYSSNENSMLVVNLPPKCADGGLELNPAYVEQRIHDAIATGEADEYEFGFHRLELGRKLGKGAFGHVYIADAYGMHGNPERTTVAIKILKDNASEDEKDDFKMEINFMKTIGTHENVVTILGCCTLYEPLCLIVEYVPHGDLLHYLRDLRKKFEYENRKRQDRLAESLGNKLPTPRTPVSGSQSFRLPSDHRLSPRGSPRSSFSGGQYSHRVLAPSLSDTELLSDHIKEKAKRTRTSPFTSVFNLHKDGVARRPLRMVKSEGKEQHSNLEDRKYEKFFEPAEVTKLKNRRSLSATSLTIAKGLASFLPRSRKNSLQSKDTESPYVGRGEGRDTSHDVSNETCLTTAGSLSAKDKSNGAVQARAVCLDGALDSSDLESFAFQIANGMEYLAGKGILHRDIAARNILVGENKVLKISDFGLSREGVYVKRSTGKIPLRWLSIEAMMDRIYSTASDIWAFGIVLWEICTLGGFPYPTVNDRDLLIFLLDGKRMNKPSNCTDDIYQLMLACWSRDPDDRPSFHSLRNGLWIMQKEEQPYVNVDPNQDFTLPPVTEDLMGNLMLFSDNTTGLVTSEDSCEDEQQDVLDHESSHEQDIDDHSDLPPPPQELEQLDIECEENNGYESSSSSENVPQTKTINGMNKRAAKRDKKSPLGRRLSPEIEEALDESSV